MKRKFTTEKNSRKKLKKKKFAENNQEFILKKKKELEEGYETNDELPSSSSDSSDSNNSDTDDESESDSDLELFEDLLHQVDVTENDTDNSDGSGSDEDDDSDSDDDGIEFPPDSSDDDDDDSIEFDDTPSTDKQTLLKQIDKYEFSHKSAEKIAPELKEDVDVLKTLAIHRLITFEEIPDKLKSEPKILLGFLTCNSSFAKNIPEGIFKDKQFSMDALKEGVRLKYIPKEFHNDPEIAKLAITERRSNWKYLDERFTKDAEFMLKAIKQDERHYLYADKSLKLDFNFNLKAIEANGAVLAYLPKNYQKDKFIVLKCAQHSTSSVYSLDDEIINDLLKDKNFVLELIRWSPHICHRISLEMAKDRTIAYESIKRLGHSLEYFPHFHNDKELVLLSLESPDNTIDTVPWMVGQLKRDKEVVLKFFQNTTLGGIDPDFIDEIFEQFVTDKEFIFELVKANDELIDYVIDNTEVLKYINELIIQCPRTLYKMLNTPHLHHQIKINPYKLLKTILPSMKITKTQLAVDKKGYFKINKIRDKNILEELMKINGEFFEMIDRSMVTDHLRLIACKNGKSVDPETDEELDHSFYIAMLEYSKKNLVPILELLEKYDKDFLLKVIQIHPKAMTLIRELPVENFDYEFLLQLIMSAFKSINFCEKIFDECETIDDYLVNGLCWVSPLSVRNDDRILQIIWRRRDFHFNLMKSEQFEDVIIKHANK